MRFPGYSFNRNAAYASLEGLPALPPPPAAIKMCCYPPAYKQMAWHNLRRLILHCHNNLPVCLSNILSFSSAVYATPDAFCFLKGSDFHISLPVAGSGAISFTCGADTYIILFTIIGLHSVLERFPSLASPV